MSKVNEDKPNLLFVSHVLPFPKASGQNLRVFYMMLAAKQNFRITFLTLQDVVNSNSIKSELSEICDELIVIPSKSKKNKTVKFIYKVRGLMYSLGTGLKFSNFILGNVELTAKHIEKAIVKKEFDLVIYEYWHAYKSVELFRKKGIPVLLDTHNILYQSYIRQPQLHIPLFLRKYYEKRYKAIEEYAWKAFNGIIAINKNEYNEIRESVSSKHDVFLIEMGVDLDSWPYSWIERPNPSLAYYGSLGSSHNKNSALICAQKIMPLIWLKFPELHLWIIGSNPDEELIALQKDSRIHVTGYVKNVQDALKNANILLCPWIGTFGFRSRLIEVMATGLPVITTLDAVDGISLEEGKGIFYALTPDEFATFAIDMLDDPSNLKFQSLEARKQTEIKYSYEATYVSGFLEIKNKYFQE